MSRKSSNKGDVELFSHHQEQKKQTLDKQTRNKLKPILEEESEKESAKTFGVFADAWKK